MHRGFLSNSHIYSLHHISMFSARARLKFVSNSSRKNCFYVGIWEKVLIVCSMFCLCLISRWKVFPQGKDCNYCNDTPPKRNFPNTHESSKKTRDLIPSSGQSLSEFLDTPPGEIVAIFALRKNFPLEIKQTQNIE